MTSTQNVITWLCIFFVGFCVGTILDISPKDVKNIKIQKEVVQCAEEIQDTKKAKRERIMTVCLGMPCFAYHKVNSFEVSFKIPATSNFWVYFDKNIYDFKENCIYYITLVEVPKEKDFNVESVLKDLKGILVKENSNSEFLKLLPHYGKSWKSQATRRVNNGIDRFISFPENLFGFEDAYDYYINIIEVKGELK